MAISVDVLNTTLSDISSEMVLALEKKVPILDRLRSKGAVNKGPTGGTYFEAVSMGTAPTTAVGVYTGAEVASGARALNTKKFSVESHRFFAAVQIPKQDLERNDGKLGVVRLIDSYPKATISGIYRDINSWLLAANDSITGLKVFDAPGLAGFATLNGQYVSTAGRVGVTNGLLDFAAPGSQTDTVQNVAKSRSYEIYNQYDDISSWATEGIETITNVYQTCAEYSSNEGPDLGVCDAATFANLLTYSADTVRIASTDAAIFGKKSVNQMMLFNATIYRDSALSLSLFTGDAADGVLYLLNTDDIEMNYFELPKVGPFKEYTPLQDVVAAQVSGSMNLVMRRFNSQGVVSGGGTP